jgi:hypothetical protein
MLGLISPKNSHLHNIARMVFHRWRKDLMDVSVQASRVKSLPAHSSVDPQTILRVPCRKTNCPDKSLRRKIATFVAALLGKRMNEIEPRLPEIMPMWGKVRIVDGDFMCCTWATESRSEKGRNMSFIRVSVLLSKLIYSI